MLELKLLIPKKSMHFQHIVVEYPGPGIEKQHIPLSVLFLKK